MWSKNEQSESTTSLLSGVTTIATDSHDTSSLNEEKPSEDLELTISPFLGQSGLCDLIYLGAHPFIFNGYAQAQPRPDLEYELRLIRPPNSMSKLPNAVALIRENKRIRLVNGPREKECCHGWLRNYDQCKAVEKILTELGQVQPPKAGSASQYPEGAKGKTVKVIATVLTLEVVGVPEVLCDEPIFQQAHAIEGTSGGFISAAFDTRNLLTERGLVGLLDWKVVLV